MDFFTLPDAIFLKIFRCLPFEDRVRAGGVDSAFRRMSKIAISETKVLDIDEYVRYGNHHFTPLAFSALIKLCADNLQQMTFTSCWSRDDDEEEKLAPVVNALLDVFGHFHCPKLTMFICKMDGGGTAETLRTVLTNNPNLEALLIGNITFPYSITSERLVTIICHCTEDGLRSLIGRVPNLRSFDAEVKFVSPASALSFDRFLGTVPNLETLTLRLSGYGLDLETEEAMDSFFQLKRLVRLEIAHWSDGGTTSNMGDNTLIKVAESFPELFQLSLPSDEITGRGLTALSSLQYLRVLTLRDYHERDNDEDDWSATVVRELGKCRSLRWISLVGFYALSLPALGQLCRSCPQLSSVRCWDLEPLDDGSEEQAAALVHQSFAGIGKRRIEFTFDNTTRSTKNNVDIWRSKPMQDALNKLKEEQGLELELELECEWMDE